MEFGELKDKRKTHTVCCSHDVWSIRNLLKSENTDNIDQQQKKRAPQKSETVGKQW